MRRIKFPDALPVMLAIAGSIFSAAVAAQSYEIVEIDPARALSDDNTWTGTYTDQSGTSSAYISCEGCPITELGLLPFGTYSHGFAISDSGQYVAGIADTSNSPNTSRVRDGFLWDGSTMSALAGVPASDEVRSIDVAYGVNDSGQVAGTAVVPTTDGTGFRAFLWDQDLQVLNVGEEAGYRVTVSDARAINNRGQIVGGYQRVTTEEPINHSQGGFLWENGAFQHLPISGARDINEKSQVVGFYHPDATGARAVLWENGNLHDLGLLLPGDINSVALSINDNGQIVGWSDTSIDFYPYYIRAFLWQCGQMLDLNELIPADSGWFLMRAEDINNNGQIIGQGLKDGRVRGFLLKPLPGGPGGSQGSADEQGQEQSSDQAVGWGLGNCQVPPGNG